MTTQDDLAFRKRYFIDVAKGLEMKAAELMKQAVAMRERAAKIPDDAGQGGLDPCGIR